jgi:hypothetical protein
MNWTWNVRSRDGAMNGLEFARCTTAGGFHQVLVYAAPAQATVGPDTVLAGSRHARTVPGTVGCRSCVTDAGVLSAVDRQQ